MAKTYLVKEIFGPTLQGEGSHAGVPVVFLRLSKCNKWSGAPAHKPKSICNYCDTDFNGGTRMTADQIVAKLVETDDSLCRRVVISGGEPTLQLDEALLLAIKASVDPKGWEIHLETNGSNRLGEMLDLIDHITMSPKQPLAETMLEECDDLKILWPPIHPDITPEAFEGFEHGQLYLQPVMQTGYESNLIKTVDKVIELDCRLSLQTHKIIGVQ